MSVEPPLFRRKARRTSPGDKLRQAILRLCDDHGQILDHQERNWASITFAGSRHTFSILFAGNDAVAAGERFIAALPEHEFTLPGHLVADAMVEDVDHRLLPTPRLAVRCALLLLEDA